MHETRYLLKRGEVCFGCLNTFKMRDPHIVRGRVECGIVGADVDELKPKPTFLPRSLLTLNRMIWDDIATVGHMTFAHNQDDVLQDDVVQSKSSENYGPNCNS